MAYVNAISPTRYFLTLHLREIVSIGCRPIPELTIFVPTRGPQTAILLQHHGVLVACSHGLHALRDHLHEIVSIDFRPIPELTIFVQPFVSAAKAVAAGGYHSMLLKQDGSLWATGSNKHGQLGHGSITFDKTFVKIDKGDR